jgi:hemoglobin-like flavoprotein
MMASSNPIERSFELAAERCEDLTQLVYRRLFDAHPEARTMFRTEGSDLVKGSMLALTIDAILDFAGERTGHFRLIISEFPRTMPARDQQKWKPVLRPIAR